MSTSEVAPGPVVQTVSADGLNIHYEQSGSGPPLVLIHGLTGSVADWQFVAVPFLTARFTVLTWDLRGHGYTDMPRSGYTSADMAGDLKGLLDALGIEKAHIAGHSFGGAVGLHFAALYPERVLALTVSDCRIWSLQPTQKIRDWAYWPVWKEQLKKQGLTLDEEADLDFTTLDPLYGKRWAEWQQQVGPNRRGEHWKKLLDSTTARMDLRDPAGLTHELIGEIQVPVQAIYGEYSFCLPTLAQLKRLLPNLKTSLLPGVGHFYPIIKPTLFVERIKSFHSPPAPEPAPDAERTDAEGVPEQS
jgi:pimeloyl-ACP methyl ester carboxylesterase